MSSEPTATSRDQPDTPERPLFVDSAAVFDDVQDVLGPTWHLPVVYHLLENGPARFSTLKTEIDGISSKMLSESLSNLEALSIVHREVLTEQPVRVEYSLTERGRALEGIVRRLLRWGMEPDPEQEPR
jgi:DNA-binding HxlR family transcriptional regulator